MLRLGIHIPGQQAGGVSSNVFEKWCILWDGSYNSINLNISLFLIEFFIEIIVRTDRVVDSFLQKRFRSECLFNDRDVDLLINSWLINTCERHFEKPQSLNA